MERLPNREVAGVEKIRTRDLQVQTSLVYPFDYRRCMVAELGQSEVKLFFT